MESGKLIFRKPLISNPHSWSRLPSINSEACRFPFHQGNSLDGDARIDCFSETTDCTELRYAASVNTTVELKCS